MSTHQGATEGFHVSKRHTTLELIGGYDCTPGVEHQNIDLDVRGGARIRKTLCAHDIHAREGVFEGNVTVLGDITADDICADKVTADVVCAREFVGNLAGDADCIIVGEDINVQGNIKGNLMVDSATFGGNVCFENAKLEVTDCNFGNVTIDSLTAEMLQANVLMVDDFSVKGNIDVDGNFNTQGSHNVSGSLFIAGNLEIGMLILEADLTVGNATVENLNVGNLIVDMITTDSFKANTLTTLDLDVSGNVSVAGSFAVSGDLLVDNITANTLSANVLNTEMAMANVFVVKQDLQVDGNLEILGDLNVDNIEANVLNAEMAMANVFVVKQDEVVQGNLIIQGGTQIVANIGDIAISEIGLNPTLLDAFGRQKVSNPFTLIDNKFLSNREPEQWDELVELSGNITYQRPYLTLEAFGAGDRAVRQTRQYLPYQPGKGLSILATGTLEVSGNADVTTRIGFFDDANDKDLAEDTEGSGNGYFFEWDGNVVNVVERSFISGIQVDTKAPQTSWNIDTFDGTGPSGLTLDLTKRQIFTFELEWLGVGSVVTGFFIGRKARWAHVFYHANLASDLPYITRPTLPVRYEAISQGGVATMRQICATVISDGGYEPKGGIYSASMGAGTTTSIGATHTPLVAIRLKPDFRRVTLNLLKTTVLAVSGNDFYVALYRFVAPATDPFTGAYTWQSAGPNSAAEYMVNLNVGDITSFTNTNGVLLDESYVSNRIDTGGSDLADRLGAIVTANISGYSDILVVAAGPDMGVQAAAAMQWQELE